MSDTFIKTINANKGIIYKVANAYCKNEEDRKDLIQEIIIQLWRSFPKYNPQFKISTWMYRIALNVSISFYNKESRRKKIAQPLSDNILFLSDEDVPKAENEQVIRLRKYISELKEIDRALIILFLEGNDHQEIAEILGLSITNVATKVGRIKEKLRKKFQL